MRTVLRAAEVAEILGMSRQNVYNLVRSGRLKQVKHPWGVGVRRSEVGRYVRHRIHELDKERAFLVTSAADLAGGAGG